MSSKFLSQVEKSRRETQQVKRMIRTRNVPISSFRENNWPALQKKHRRMHVCVCGCGCYSSMPLLCNNWRTKSIKIQYPMCQDSMWIRGGKVYNGILKLLPWWWFLFWKFYSSHRNSWRIEIFLMLNAHTHTHKLITSRNETNGINALVRSVHQMCRIANGCESRKTIVFDDHQTFGKRRARIENLEFLPNRKICFVSAVTVPTLCKLPNDFVSNTRQSQRCTGVQFIQLN